MSKNKKEVKNVENIYMSASDIVNGTPSLYKIDEEEMQSDLENIYEELGIEDDK